MVYVLLEPWDIWNCGYESWYLENAAVTTVVYLRRRRY